MDEFRARIHDDLRGIIKGDLLFESVERAPYALDASLYEIDPLGVVAPSTRDDLTALVRYAADQGISLHARGAGTGLAGGCLGRGIVVDFSRYLRRIIEVRSDSVVVQPGVVLDVLNAQLAPLGRRIGPDPGRSEARTIGGMIAVDSAGARSLRDGSMVDHVERLAVVFANGEAAELALGPWPSADDEAADFQGAVARKVAMLLTWHADLIARYRPRMPRRWPGYALTEVGRNGGLDLSRLIVGSEGTLALVTEATVRTVPIPGARAVIVLPFIRLNDAAKAVLHCLEDRPSACELHDWRSIRLVRDADPFFRDAIAEAAESVLIVEFEGDDPETVTRQARALAYRLVRTGRLVADPFTTARRSDCERLIGLRRAVVPLLMRSRDPARAIPLIEDIAVPPEDLAAFLNRLQGILREHGISWTLYAHAGAGELHARPFLDLADPRDLARLEPLAAEVYDAVAEFGGSISGEHGCGLSRTQFLHKHYGELDAVFREIKNAFDPQNLLNPGKVVGDDPHLIVQDLRPLLVPGATPGTPGALPVPSAPLIWPDGRRDEHVSACNACGACRSREPTMRMCPAFRATGAEAASPRAKTQLLRQIASGALDPKTRASEELKEVADLCVHCNMCTIECQGGVDVSSLMLEAKAAFVEDHGLTTNDWLLSRVDLWSALASRTPLMFNALMNHRGARWLLERMFGLSRHRLLPKAHRTTFLRRAERLGLTRARPRAPGPRVAFFVDIVANHFDQRLAETVVAVLQHAGINVFVPKGQRGCGMAALVAGDLDHARDLVLTNLRVLANAVRDGYTIVCAEPTAALMLRRESIRLTDDLDAVLVATNTMDVGQYLIGLDARGQLPPFTQPLHAKIGYHQPCHLRALNIGTPGLDLIRKIPELEVEFIDRGCSGMAGTFGLARQNFRASLRAGRPLRSRLRDSDLELGTTECSACRMQMEQGLSKHTRHPMELLSLAYGLNPSLRQHVKDAKKK